MELTCTHLSGTDVLDPIYMSLHHGFAPAGISTDGRLHELPSSSPLQAGGHGEHLRRGLATSLGQSQERSRSLPPVSSSAGEELSLHSRREETETEKPLGLLSALQESRLVARHKTMSPPGWSGRTQR